MKVSPLPRAALVAACAMALSGCLGALAGKPADLYRFGQSATATQTAPAGAIGVFYAGGTFQREAAGDRILTVEGGKAAYAAKTRWVAPAESLWRQAVLAAFDADGGPVRLISRGEPAGAAHVLRLDVRNFETQRAGKAAPTVVVRVRAALTTGKGSTTVTEQMFEARVKASENRVGGIVEAYDQAVAKVAKDVVAWTNAQTKP